MSQNYIDNYYETNELRTRGFRLAQPLGTIITADEYAYNNTVTLYTTPEDKIMYLDFYSYCAHQTTNAWVNGQLCVTDESDVVVWTLQWVRGYSVYPFFGSHDFLRPYTVPAGYKVKIISSATDLYLFASIKGEECSLNI